ncbi:MAG: hypothetical protein ABIM98_00010 [candidate division WOR-3 bacterium]
MKRKNINKNRNYGKNKKNVYKYEDRAAVYIKEIKECDFSNLKFEILEEPGMIHLSSISCKMPRNH